MTSFSKTEWNCLKNCELVGNLPDAARQALLKVCEHSIFNKNSYVHCKGDSFTGVFILLSGHAKAMGTTADGSEYCLSPLGPGQVFGEIAYLDGGIRTHDVCCLWDCVFARLSQMTLDDLTRKHPVVYQELVKLACSHVRQSFRVVDDFLVLSPERLLAKRMIELSHHYEVTGRIAASQDDLASLIGVSRQSTNRILRRWQEKGWVQLNYSAVTLVDTAALSDLVGT